MREVKVIKRKSGIPFLIAKLGKEEDKIAIMTNKNKLKSTKYYISHDRTTKERYIQQQIINIAHEEG